MYNNFNKIPNIPNYFATIANIIKLQIYKLS